jgi:hypothetical protein
MAKQRLVSSDASSPRPWQARQSCGATEVYANQNGIVNRIDASFGRIRPISIAGRSGHVACAGFLSSFIRKTGTYASGDRHVRRKISEISWKPALPPPKFGWLF